MPGDLHIVSGEATENQITLNWFEFTRIQIHRTPQELFKNKMSKYLAGGPVVNQLSDVRAGQGEAGGSSLPRKLPSPRVMYMLNQHLLRHEKQPSNSAPSVASHLPCLVLSPLPVVTWTRSWFQLFLGPASDPNSSPSKANKPNPPIQLWKVAHTFLQYEIYKCNCQCGRPNKAA